MPRNVELEHNSAVPEHVHAITLVRHGRTAYNAQHRLQGQIDIPLDEVGQWQVRQTADALRELYSEPAGHLFRSGACRSHRACVRRPAGLGSASRHPRA